MKKFMVLFFSLFWIAAAHAAVGEITFENDQLPAGQQLTAADSFWNGSTGSGGLTSFDCGGASFNNYYSAAWSSWGGYGYSNRTDTTVDGFTAQYNAIPGIGAMGSTNYGVGYVDAYNSVTPTVTFPAAQTVTGFYVTNSNYAYFSMLNGDAYAKKFEAGDWFLLTITGKDAGGNSVGVVSTYLAVGTDILQTWQWVDLGGLGQVKSLEFTLTSSDTGAWGMNTPAYFCIDSINAPRPIPTLSEWGMIVFSVLLVLMTLWIMRKRRSGDMA